jgi:hypothetical protein
MEDGLGCEYSAFGRDEMYVQKFWLGSQKGREHLADISMNGRIILKLILKE